MSELTRIFDESVPQAFQRGMLQVLINAYKVARRSCEPPLYPPEIAHDLYPYLRRSVFERDLLTLAQRFAGVHALSYPNRTRSAYHTKVIAGKVVLTVSAVDHPKELVRKAEFRETYARDYQLHLFDNELPPEPGLLYCLLLHGPAQTVLPGFVDIVFPDPECEKYVDRISLYRRFSEVARANQIPEEIIKEPTPELRRQIPKITGESFGEQAIQTPQEEIQEPKLKIRKRLPKDSRKRFGEQI